LEKVCRRPCQLLDKHSGKKARAVHRQSKLAESEKARQAKGKVKGMLIILFDSKGIVCKKFVLAGETVNENEKN
jgi:hypothetical protein